MVKTQIYNIGLEELAVAIGYLGKLSEAKGMLVANFGAMSADEERGRLQAATHSLVAKELLLMSEEEPMLEKNFKETIEKINNYDFALRVSLGSMEKEETLTYYFVKKKIIRHRNKYGISQNISYLENVEGIYNEISKFLIIKDKKPYITDKFEMSPEELEEARRIANSEPKVLKKYLKSLKMSPNLVPLFSEDLIAEVVRGSLMKIIIQDGQMISNEGFLLLKGNKRNWIMPITLKDNKPIADILSGTISNLKRELQKLIK